MAGFKREVLVLMLAAPSALMVEPWTVMSAGRVGVLVFCASGVLLASKVTSPPACKFSTAPQLAAPIKVRRKRLLRCRGIGEGICI